MDKPIQVGDLVMVVKPLPCCGGTPSGRILTVDSLQKCRVRCDECGSIDGGKYALTDDGFWYELSRLKRIPPLSELDDVKRDEEITA